MTIEELERVKKAVIRKYPISAGLAMNGLKIELSDSIETAAVFGEKNTDGKLVVKCLKINPDFFDLLSFSQKVFVLAHEACHIALKHFARALDRPERDAKQKYEEYCQIESDEHRREIMKNILYQKYHRIWNIATDACINAFLKKDGLAFPQDIIDPRTGQKMHFVDIESGRYKSAEKIYDYLVKKEEEKEKQKEKQQKNDSSPQESNEQSSSSGQSTDNMDSKQSSSSNISDLDNVDIDGYNGFDSHDEWTGDLEPNEKEQSISEQEEDYDEEKIFDKDANEREKKDKPSLKDSFSKVRGGSGLDSIVPVKPVLSWKRLLVGTLEKTEEVWGTRRSSKFNPNARIEERVYEKLPSVEVVLDTSGSISNSLLKGFLLQLCPLFEAVYGENVTIKVGCFGSSFSGFQIIRTKQDILDFRPVIGGGTNFEKAATSFTPDPGRQITKIVFTDGVLGTPQVTRVDDIIWLVFGNKMNFTPLGGRIIKISKEEYESMKYIITELIVKEEKTKRSVK